MRYKEEEVLKRVAIGSAQFGMDYGAMNRTGQPPIEEVRRILEFARKEGVSCLDTAAAYGESESVLGEIGVCDWQVITKLQPGENPEDSLARSLERLKCDQIYACLAHSAEEWQRAGVVEALRQAKEDGKVQKIGVSVYNPDEYRACRKHADLDLVQFPFNVVDQRMKQSGLISEMFDEGIELHARSIFWQGLLLAEPEDLPEGLGKRADLLDEWHGETSVVPKLESALAFVLAEELIDKIVVGAETFEQIEDTLGAMEIAANLDDVPDGGLVASDDPLLVEPRHWQKN